MKVYAGQMAALLAVVLAASVPGVSHACGACDEDNIAATYDHAVVERAATRGDVMVFCAVTGPIDTRRLAETARRVRGIQPDSVRVSAQPPALSFALDPRVQSPQAAVDAVQRGSQQGASLSILRLLNAESRGAR